MNEVVISFVRLFCSRQEVFQKMSHHENSFESDTVSSNEALKIQNEALEIQSIVRKFLAKSKKSGGIIGSSGSTSTVSRDEAVRRIANTFPLTVFKLVRMFRFVLSVMKDLIGNKLPQGSTESSRQFNDCKF